MMRTARLMVAVVAMGSWACGGDGAPFGGSGGSPAAPSSTGGNPGSGGTATDSSGGAPYVAPGTGGAAVTVGSGGASAGGSTAVSTGGKGTGGGSSGGATAASGGQPGSGGAASTGGGHGSGGTQATGGSGTGGAAQTGGSPGTGGVVGVAGMGTGVIGTGGVAGSGNGGAMTASGGMFSLPPPPIDPAPSNSSLTFAFTDQCVDGETYAMRYFDEDTGFVWPLNALTGGVFTGHGDGTTDKSTLACIYGDKICFGAEPFPIPDGKYWGVDVDNSQGCIGCCHPCGQITPVTFNLTCF